VGKRFRSNGDCQDHFAVTGIVQTDGVNKSMDLNNAELNKAPAVRIAENFDHFGMRQAGTARLGVS